MPTDLQGLVSQSAPPAPSQAAPQAPQPSQPQPQPSQAASGLDPQAIAMSQAIRQVESGGNPTAQGASGEYGAYQWEPDTWASMSKAAGVNVPLDQSTLQQQNQVAYTQIKAWKDEGYNVGQIASMWNAGEGDPNAYLEDHEGTNAEGVNYNTPAYAQKVATLYQQYKQQSGTINTPSQPNQINLSEVPGQPSQPDSLAPNLGDIGQQLGQNIASRFQTGANAVGMIGQGGLSGNIPEAASGVLQTAGAVAGGVGDVLNAGLQLIPGVETIENGVGSALGSLAQTNLGQRVVGGVSQWAQAHPEISGDIAAAVNIGSLIPMFKGVSLISGGVTDAATSALKGNLEDAAQSELKNMVTTKTAQASLSGAESRGLDPLGYLTSDPAKNMPAITEAPGGAFQYDGTKAAQNIQASLSQDEEKLQNSLSQVVKKGVGVNINDVQSQMVKDMLKEFPVSRTGGQAVKEVNKAFDEIAPTLQGRSFIDLNELNGLKRDIGNTVNWNNLGSSAGEIKSAMYRSLMDQVESIGEKNGVQGIGDINKVMGEKIEAMKVLKNITGKTVKQSRVGKIVREVGSDVAGGAAEIGGNQMGIPFASTLAGRGLYRMLPGRVPLTAVRLLSRGGRGTVASSIGQGLLKSGAAQGLRGLVSNTPGQ